MNILVHLKLKSTRTFPSSRVRAYTTRSNILSYAPPRVLRPHIYHQISASRLEAADNAARIAKEEFTVYADGSRYHGGVGAAARTETPLGMLVIKEHLGLSEEHLPVEGELLSITLGLRIINTMPFLTRATIFVDCQQAIREAVSGRSVHRELIARFDAELRGTRRSLRSLRIAWVPGHEGVAMNEAVDKDAKAAAEGESSTRIIISPAYYGQVQIGGRLL
ncbi:hypothetical protein B0H17DRAFT_1099693 [Mycena rosella]|uniref:RNase H type-1 domain-containing protein n=1 Tax=Mycena rosella TaxID=1033263 RepID=A0AAD7CNH1_MYCRO|nr:hypothetical protein B0H17DRAFT_1099693 [Mycena rosella]